MQGGRLAKYCWNLVSVYLAGKLVVFGICFLLVLGFKF